MDAYLRDSEVEETSWMLTCVAAAMYSNPTQVVVYSCTCILRHTSSVS